MHDEMNKLLKSALSAIETYQQALEKKDTDPAHVTAIDALSRILADHQRARSEDAHQRSTRNPADARSNNRWLDVEGLNVAVANGVSHPWRRGPYPATLSCCHPPAQ